MYDRDFVEALEHGMPPASGFGVSERLFAFLANRSVRDTQLFLSEVRRVLRPGGRLALTTPAGSRWRVLLFGIEHPFSPHLRTFTRRSLRGVLDAMGFQVLSLETRKGTLLTLAVR